MVSPELLVVLGQADDLVGLTESARAQPAKHPEA